MKPLFAFLLAVTLLTACSKEPESGYNPTQKADRTVLVYMPGTSLIYFFNLNIAGIRKAVDASTPGSNNRILICYQPQNNSSAVLQEIYYDRKKGRSEIITLKTYTDFEASSSESVGQLFADAAAIAPAKHNGLIIGCHGKAWIPAQSGLLQSRNRKRTASDYDLFTPAEGALPTRSFGDSRHEMDIKDLANALGALSHKFEYLLFDDCFMANIETVYDLRSSVDYVIGAPCEIMAAGFPYDRIIPLLFAYDTTLGVLTKACYEFWNFYENDWNTISGNQQSGCISITATAELPALAEVMRRVNGAKGTYNINELQYYEGLSSHLFYDLGHYVSLACTDTALRNEFAAQLKRTVPIKYNTAKYYSTYNKILNPITYYSGISVSEPATRFVSENRQTNWYQATH